jgi:hypothetical protein
MVTAAEKKTEDWMTTKWRPLMAVTYMATIWFDFIAGPILFNVLQYFNPGQAISSYIPITLQGGGLYHISMGAILGIAAWTRGKEKVAAIEAGERENNGVRNSPRSKCSSTTAVDYSFTRGSTTATDLDTPASTSTCSTNSCSGTSRNRFW